MTVKERLIIGITIILWIVVISNFHIPTFFTNIKVDEECAISYQEYKIPISMISVAINNDGYIFIYMEKSGHRLITKYNNEGEFIHTIVVGKFSEGGELFINEDNVLSLVNDRSIKKTIPMKSIKKQVMDI
ncbi:hypothetical protein [Haloplasma contractile]|uniref:Uncharacterized protein n=1 Tax=Haloplasma contractile SSD-17B TaxID=1033810 RepID=U2EF84_9MOLU|nr:hypothetical protein [Haloplasma contractile]ERJ13341.1 hypothetical protein HLPCO_000970 [Haloplasma contractile SSD-17B]